MKTPDEAHLDELARLERVVTENDAQDSPDAAWRAAQAVFEQAELVEPCEGVDAALRLYGEVVRRLEGHREPGPRELLICAMNNIATILHEQGRDQESRSVAAALVGAHFDDPPPPALAVVLDGALLLADLLADAGEHDAALDLLERVSGRARAVDGTGDRLTAAAAASSTARVLDDAGRSEQALQKYEEVVLELGAASDPILRQILARTMARRASLLNREGRFAERDALCRAIVDRFDPGEGPEVAEWVEWARAGLGGGLRRRWYKKRHGRN